jgi:hypothetical protein
LPAAFEAAFFAGLALLACLDLLAPGLDDLDLAGFALTDLAADDLRSAEDERAAILIQPVFVRFIHNGAIT